MKYLKIMYPRVPIFYSLPKVHKSLKDPPGQSKISGNGSLTKAASKYINKVLRPFVMTKSQRYNAFIDYVALCNITREYDTTHIGYGGFIFLNTP